MPDQIAAWNPICWLGKKASQPANQWTGQWPMTKYKHSFTGETIEQNSGDKHGDRQVNTDEMNGWTSRGKHKNKEAFIYMYINQVKFKKVSLKI